MEDKEYASVGKDPAHRVRVLLGKLKTSRRGKERGYNPSRELIHTAHKFMRPVDHIFNNLPKPLEWLSFLNNDLPLLIDFCEEVQEVSTQLSLTQLGLDPECKWTEAALAQRLGVTRGKVAQIVNNTNFGEINTLLSQGRDMDYIARHYRIDLAMAWALHLEAKSDRERFEALNWGLRTWDHCYFNDLDQRFGDNWPAYR